MRLWGASLTCTSGSTDSMDILGEVSLSLMCFDVVIASVLCFDVVICHVL